MGTVLAAGRHGFFAVAVALGLSACQLAPYDAETYNASLQNLKSILTFFDTATDATGDERSYARLKAGYATIENDLVLLTARERTRAYNNDSAASARKILDGWRDLRRVHRCRYTTAQARTAGEGADCNRDPAIDYAPGAMSNWVLERQRQHFIAMFEHLMAGEVYKEGAPDGSRQEGE